VEHLAVPAAHRDLVACAFDGDNRSRRPEKGHGRLVGLHRRPICLVHENEVALHGDNVLAHCLSVSVIHTLRECELLALHLLLLRARSNIPKTRRTVATSGDDGVDVEELDLFDTPVKCAKCQYMGRYSRVTANTQILV